MNTVSSICGAQRGPRLLVVGAWAGFFLALATTALAQATGGITGTVSNTATGKMLEGALVTIAALDRNEISDPTGRFAFSGLPAGEYVVTVSYTGLKSDRRSARVEAGQVARLDFELSSDIYQMAQFVVTGDREGNAAAITRQRNADSVKHVVAMGAFGNLANDNAGELLLRLPGLAGQHDLDGNISEVFIRGTSSNLNMVTVDGNLMASNFSDSRSFAFRSVSGALFSEIEVTKAPTPDMPADSIGGAVNFKSASALDLKGRQRVSYSSSFRWALRGVENVPMAYEHPLHPTLKLNWQEIHDVFGGERNLGVTLNAFYSENSSGGFTGTYLYQPVLDRRAYLYDFQSRDIYNNRKQRSVSLRFDYRLSPATTLNFSALFNEDDQPFNYWYIMRAVTGQTVATLNTSGQPTGTGTILPDYTTGVTHVRGLNNSQIILTSQLIGFNDQQLNVNAGARHKWDRLQVNYDAAFSRSKSVLDTGEHGHRAGGGNFTASVRNVGWTVDRSASDEYPSWAQTEGPNISDPAVYAPSTLARRNNWRGIDIFTAKGNGKYLLPAAVPANAATGFSFRRQELRRRNADRQWAPVDTSAGALRSLVNLDWVETSAEDRMGRQVPFIDPADLVKDIRENPARWRENLYYGATRRYIGNDKVSEDVLAGYAQGQVQLGRLRALAGVRYERTDVSSAGYVPSPVLSTTARQNADPVGSAIADYRNYRATSGAYDQWFPGVHLSWRLAKDLLLRASWSNSIGRPGFTTLVPTFSVNHTTEVVNVNNAGLGPQTSENWDAGFEYYFEPVGLLSANVFRKNMQDFIVTGGIGTVGSGANNGFNGDYAGYSLNTTFNGGTATIEGVELAYQQRFEFLPKPFNGLAAFANYTWLRTEGDYGEPSTTPPSTKDVVDFIPEAINAGLSYNYRGFGARVMWNETGRFLNTYNANPALLRYTVRRTMLDASVSYRLREACTLFVDVRNITNSPRSWARASGVTNAYIFFTSVNFGVKGEF